MFLVFKKRKHALNWSTVALMRFSVLFCRINNNRPLSVYRDENSNTNDRHSNMNKNDKSWNSLGSRSDRNKENTSMPSRWTSYKVAFKYTLAYSITAIAHNEYHLFHLSGSTKRTTNKFSSTNSTDWGVCWRRMYRVCPQQLHFFSLFFFLIYTFHTKWYITYCTTNQVS